MDPESSRADPVMVNNIIDQLKSRGIFDQFRRDCLADVDTKPAYQNLRQRVEGYVSNYLGQNKWEPSMNKNQLRDSLRRQINQSEMLATGVERIIEQVVEPKIQHIFRPQIERLVKERLNPVPGQSATDSANTTTNINNVNNAASLRTDHVALPYGAKPPGASSIEVALPPPLPPDNVEGIGEEDMDISTPSPTSSPDIRLSSPIDVSRVESPPPIPGVEVDEAVDFDISQTIYDKTNVTNIKIQDSPKYVEMSIKTHPEGAKSVTPEIRIATSPEEVSAKMAGFISLLDHRKRNISSGENPQGGSALLVKQTEQMQIVGAETKSKGLVQQQDHSFAKILVDKDISNIQLQGARSAISAEEEEGSALKKGKRDAGADSDGESGLSDITVSSVHTSDLSSFDEEISSSSESQDSESDQSSESSFSDKFSDDSKKTGPSQKSPRKSFIADPVEVSYRIVKLAHRDQGFFMDKYIYVKNKENTEKLFLRCQHKYLCKAIAYIDKVTDKAYVKQGHHVHPPPDVRKITFGTDSSNKPSILEVTKKPSSQEKPKKKSHSPPKIERKVAPIKLSFPKPPTPPKEDETGSRKSDSISEIDDSPGRKEDNISRKEDSISTKESATDSEPGQLKKDDIRQPSIGSPALQEPIGPPALQELSPEAKKAEEQRWKTYWEYSMAPARRQSTKALALSRYHSDSEDEDTREERRKQAALDKEERARKRQERREQGVKDGPKIGPRRTQPMRRRKEAKMEKERKEQDDKVIEKEQASEKHRLAPDSPVKATKAQLKEQKILEKKREMRRQRSLNKRYFSDEFSSTVQENIKESLKVGEGSIDTVLEPMPLTPIKRSVLNRIKPVVLSFHFRFRERRTPQVESHFLLCNCLSGEQQKKMSSRKQKQKSRIAGKQKSRFSYNAKMEKIDTKKNLPKGRQRKGTDEPAKDSDISRSSTPVQDEIPPPLEMMELGKVFVTEDATGPRKRGRPRKTVDEDKVGERSRSSTPVQDEVVPALDTMAADKETKGEAVKRKRGRPRKYVDDKNEGQEKSSRSSTPVQELVLMSDLNVTSSSGQMRRGRPRKSSFEEKVDDSSRSSTPVQDEIIVEEMDVIHGDIPMADSVVIQDEQNVEEMDVDVNFVEEMVVSEESVQGSVIKEGKLETVMVSLREQTKSVSDGEVHPKTKTDVDDDPPSVGEVLEKNNDNIEELKSKDEDSGAAFLICKSEEAKKDVDDNPSSVGEVVEKSNDNIEESKSKDEDSGAAFLICKSEEAKNDTTQSELITKELESCDHVEQAIEEELVAQIVEESQTKRTLREQEVDEIKEQDIVEPVSEEHEHLKKAANAIDLDSTKGVDNVVKHSSEKTETELFKTHNMPELDKNPEGSKDIASKTWLQTKENRDEKGFETERKATDEQLTEDKQQNEGDSDNKVVEMEMVEGTSVDDRIIKDSNVEETQVGKAEKEFGSCMEEQNSAHIQENISAVSNSPSVPDVLKAVVTASPPDVPTVVVTPSPQDVPAVVVIPSSQDVPAVEVTPSPTNVPSVVVTSSPPDVPIISKELNAEDPQVGKAEKERSSCIEEQNSALIKENIPAVGNSPSVPDVLTDVVTSSPRDVPAVVVTPSLTDVPAVVVTALLDIPTVVITPSPPDVSTAVVSSSLNVSDEANLEKRIDFSRTCTEEGVANSLVVEQSLTTDTLDKDDEVDEKVLQPVQQVKDTDSKEEDVNDKVKKKDEGNDEIARPAVGSSPSSQNDNEDIDDGKKEVTLTEGITRKEMDAKWADGKREKNKDDNMLVPAVGHSPTNEQQKQVENVAKDDAQKIDRTQVASDLDDSPPTPTQDEPSSMDEFSPTEGADKDDKPAIPIFTVSSPSKSPLGGLFTLGRPLSVEGPSVVQDSFGAAQSQAGESSSADVDSEENVPSVSKESIQRPKRRVSSEQDNDDEYSQSKRPRTETPPLPILEPELPIECPKEETKARTTRASKQRHISPPHQYSPTPKESRIRTRHQSSQSSENQQSPSTPSPAERLTRGRRSTRQSEEKQSHRYKDMVYYDTSRRSQKQQDSSPTPAASRRSSRRSTDDRSSDRASTFSRGKRKR